MKLSEKKKQKKGFCFAAQIQIGQISLTKRECAKLSLTYAQSRVNG